jgi:hypothetical protein
MPRRLISAVLIAVFALQAIALAPTTFASGVSSLSGNCADHSGNDGPECPCCPDGTGLSADCMSLCAAFAGGFTLPLPIRMDLPGVTTSVLASSAATQTYAPLNPPPIR